MEPAPWIRDYVVDMEDLYTELSLEKIDKKLFCQKRRKLENYKELFARLNPGILEYFHIRYYIPHSIRHNIPSLRPKMILIKGDPGMGKTSLVKKIAYDWAKGEFDEISIVFFVFLKVVKPGDLINNVIMLQNPMSECLHVTAAKLTIILERFGSECLLILDGLDECALGQNSDVNKVIRGSKFKNCNVLLTSRPHSTRVVEKYFDTIVSVEGFTQSEARKFARRIVDDEGKVEQILKFNPAGERSDQDLDGTDPRSVHNVPILLSFLCLLVREDPDIDLSDKTLRMGEIYFRMVRCLYKKFTIRKGIEFDANSFVKVLESLGKFALQTLLSGNPLLQRSHITRQVGRDVFDYGLLIGHEDAHRLIRDETADIFVTFPHTSILEFLGAFSFVMCRGKEQTVESSVEAFWQYLRNPLFSQFCLWFLDESNKVFLFQERSMVSDRLIRSTAEKIDDLTINFFGLVSEFPALGLALDDHNDLALVMLEKVLKRCARAIDLAISINHPVELILTSICDNVFERLKSIKINSELIKAGRPINIDTDKLIPPESPLLFLHSPNQNVLKLSVNNVSSTESNSDVFVSVINICAKRKRLVHSLVLVNCEMILDIVVPANAEHMLPNLCVLDICGTSVVGRLHMLLTGVFPSLTTLILSDCYVAPEDFKSLATASIEGKLPELRHLDMSWNYSFDSLNKSFYEVFPKLTTLIARRCRLKSNDLCSLAQASGAGKLQHLTSLDLTINPSISGGLSVLLHKPWPSLNVLILRECELNSDDMRSLARGNALNRLPQLKLLDISMNPVGYRSESGCLSNLLSHPFPSLAYLILCYCELDEKDLDSLAQANVDGKLPTVKYIDVSFNELFGHLYHMLLDLRTGRKVSWEKIVCVDKFLDGSKK